jgi:phosphoglycerate kinase
MGEYAGLGDVAGKRVLVRSDLNVPLDGTTHHRRRPDPGERADHQGAGRRRRPGGRDRPPRAPEGRAGGPYSLRPVAARLGELLGRTVAFATDTVGESARATVEGLEDGQVALLENVRFNPGETSKDEAERGAFADELASLGDGFVSDGFGVVHRKQASVYDVAQRLPHTMGGLVAAEVEVLRRLTESPERPYVVVLGGSKVSDKLAVIDNLLGKADTLLVGGGMVFTFLAAQGHEIGKSLLEEDQIEACRDYLKRSRDTGVEIVLPTDIVVDTEFPSGDRDREPRSCRPTRSRPTPRPRHRPDSARRSRGARRRRTVFWNGPMGVFEVDAFADGTRASPRP